MVVIIPLPDSVGTETDVKILHPLRRVIGEWKGLRYAMAIMCSKWAWRLRGIGVHAVRCVRDWGGRSEQRDGYLDSPLWGVPCTSVPVNKLRARNVELEQ